MDFSILLEYGWVLIVLVALEGLLAADNAVVMAVLVKHLPEREQKKALFYGLLGAFTFRFLSLFVISILVDVWQVQAAGALYLLYISVSHFLKKKKGKKESGEGHKGDSLWRTVLKIELSDLAFAIDSILAAVAIAVTLPETGWFKVGEIDIGPFSVMLLGGIIGIVIMRFAASAFAKILKKYPDLEAAAFIIVGWVGVKLAVYTLSHPNLALLDRHFPESFAWKSIFWTVLITIALGGYLFSKRKARTADTES